MLQTATLNSPQNPTHGLIMGPSMMGVHQNLNPVAGKIMSRSPTNNMVQQQDARSLSPNKLNATKKPMINNQTNYQINNLAARNRGGTSPIPSPKYAGNNGNNLYNNYSSNQNGVSPTQFFSNRQQPPLINSNGYENKGLPIVPNGGLYDRNKYCLYHNNKVAEFVGEGEDKQIHGYCNKCAINLASRGFAVDKKSGNYPGTQRKSNIFDEHRLQAFNFPQFAGSYGYAELQNFVHKLDSTHSNYLSQIHKYQTIQEHYEHQYSITLQFYQSLLAVVDQMREDHLADLQAEAKKHTQLAYIKEDHLKSAVEEMEIIRNDVLTSLSIILSDFDNPQIQSSFKLYNQSIMSFDHLIEEENAEYAKQIINQKQPQLQTRLKKIEDYLLNVWNDKTDQQVRGGKGQIMQNIQNIQNGIKNNQFKPVANPPPNQDKSPRSTKAIFNIGQNPKPETGTACRRLFQDDNDGIDDNDQNKRPAQNQYRNNHTNFQCDELAGQMSPQFKNI